MIPHDHLYQPAFNKWAEGERAKSEQRAQERKRRREEAQPRFDEELARTTRPIDRFLLRLSFFLEHQL